MEIRTLVADGTGRASAVATPPSTAPDTGWVWIDVRIRPDQADELLRLTDRLRLDRLAVRDSISDVDLPKLDDFGHHLVVVLHGLREDRIATVEIDCFLTRNHLLTVRHGDSPSIDMLWSQIQSRAELASAPVDEVLALLADVMTRRLMSVLDAFDERVEDLVHKALRADSALLEDLTAVRTDLTAVRRVVHPQREVLDVLRHSTSALVTDAGRRRFSDVFDVASRAAAGLDEARAALAETLDAYRGAEARAATEVTKVLTVYAAIMLPLSLIAGFFGMNFVDMPWLRHSWGWIAASAVMAFVAIVSLGVFVALGWIHRPSGRETGRTLGRGLIEATRAPVQLVGAVVEMSTMPLRATTSRLGRVGRLELGADDRDDDSEPERADTPDDAEHYGSE